MPAPTYRVARVDVVENTWSDPLALLRSMSALVLASYFRPLGRFADTTTGASKPNADGWTSPDRAS